MPGVSGQLCVSLLGQWQKGSEGAGHYTMLYWSLYCTLDKLHSIHKIALRAKLEKWDNLLYNFPPHTKHFSSCACLSVCQAQATPPGFWNGVDWRVLVKDCIPKNNQNKKTAFLCVKKKSAFIFFLIHRYIYIYIFF